LSFLTYMMSKMTKYVPNLHAVIPRILAVGTKFHTMRPTTMYTNALVQSGATYSRVVNELGGSEGKNPGLPR